MITFETVETEAGKTNTNPSEAQRNAGNYKKGHISVKGMKIAIENPAGSKRYYANGTKYNVMKNHYGYFNITKGKDGDAVDVFLGPDIENFDRIYCIDQNKANGEFDETKVMLGFSSKEEAKDAYMSNYSPDWTGFRDITSVSVKDFKKWLYRGRKQRQPFADYVYIQKKKLDEMKKIIKLTESDITDIVMNSVKRALNEDVNTNDIADMLGADDSHDGPTNEGPDWDEQVYSKALSIMRKFDFDDDISIQSLEHTMYDYLDGAYQSEKIMKMSPDEAAYEMATEAMRRIDPEYYEEEVEPMLNERRVIKLSESDIHGMIKSVVSKVLKENHPTQQDWDDFGFWASNDEPDLVNDEIGAAHDKEEGFLIDADDEGEGYSRDYSQGVEYAKNLIAKSRVPEGLVDELNQKEDDGTISAFELGILDTLDEG